MYARNLSKPDGRPMTLYSRYPISQDIQAPSPSSDPIQANPHLRWHTLRGEWVVYADRNLEQKYDLQLSAELPQGQYDVAVFESRFPMMSLQASQAPESVVGTMPANGSCKVVVYSQDAQASLGSLEVEHIDLLLRVYADQTRTLGQQHHIQYVLPFQNRTINSDGSVPHPHGEIYAYPFIPPLPAKMWEGQRNYLWNNGRGLLQDMIQREIESKQRIIYLDEDAIAFVPACARYPYEVWVAPLQPTATFSDLTAYRRRGVARALKTVALKYDALWGRPFPYLMAWFQAPTDGGYHPECHLHAQFYPVSQTRDCFKYLTEMELIAGTFASDTLPEESAKELRSISVNIESPLLI